MAVIDLFNEDILILKELAQRVQEISKSKEQDEKRELWYKHNELKWTPPLILCYPGGGWKEIITEDQLACQSELGRQWEIILRKEIFWGEEMGDDYVVDGTFPVPYLYEETDWGLAMKTVGGEKGGSYTWIPPIKDYNQDLEKLRFPEIIIDYDKTEAHLKIAQEVLGEYLEVKLEGNYGFSLGLMRIVIKLRGLEQFFMDLYQYPKELKQLMVFLRDGQMRKIDFLEKNKLLTLNNRGQYLGSGGIGFCHQLPQPDFQGKVRAKDLWGFMESQETGCVSPQMFEEFVFPYQFPIIERFGLNIYGCCESLDDERWKLVPTIPNLRRVSVSPWADIKVMAERIKDDYIYSLKPKPTPLATPKINEEKIRADLREKFELTRGCHVEVIMKDNQTIGKNPENVKRWSRIAKEEAARVSYN